jgi:hypothetical protein
LFVRLGPKPPTGGREREREREREEEVGRRIHDKVGGKVVLLFGISDM